MDDDDDFDTSDGITVIIDFNQKVNVIRFLNGGLVPSKLSIRAEVIPAETAEEIDFDVTFTKIKFWFETIVSRSIIFCKNNTTAIGMMFDADTGRPNMINHLMITPFEPTDDHLAVLFQSKMTALSGGTINFGSVRIQCDNSNGLVFTYVGEWDKDLPEMKDWFSTTPYYFKTPWWTRDDASTVDMVIGKIDPDVIPSWAFKLDFIENSIRPKNNEDEEQKIKEAVVIKFKPKVIDGGKKVDDD